MTAVAMPVLIEVPAPAPLPLAERARLAAVGCEEANAAHLRAEVERVSANAREALRDQLARVLAVDVDPSRVRIEHRADGRTVGVVEVEGFTFSTVRDGSSSYYAERLVVARECTRKCGAVVWVRVEFLENFHRAATEDATHEHACLMKFDEDGEAITDENGKPLPPRVPPTPLPTASQLIARIRVAADALGEATAAEMKFADRAKHLLAEITQAARSGQIPHFLNAGWTEAREEQREALRARMLAEADLDCAKLSARLEVDREARAAREA